MKFISFYTANYAENANRLKQSLSKFGIDNSGVEYRESVGDWRANTQIKAEFILEKLRENDAVVWTDADSFLVDKPTFFDTVTTDVSLFIMSKEMDPTYKFPEYSILQDVDEYVCSGTMYFKNNERVIKLLEKWVELNKNDSRQWDQWTLQLALQSSDVTITQLPVEYILAEFIAKTVKKQVDGKIKPVIVHTGASVQTRTDGHFSRNKKTTFITTFSRQGYQHYGQRWIETFIKNTSDVNAVIFTDFDLPSPDERITVLNFDRIIPEHKLWMEEFSTAYTNGTAHSDAERKEFERRLGIRFSYKAYVMMYALVNMTGYVVWLDGDCVFKPNSYKNFARSILENNFIAVQVDKFEISMSTWRSEDHVESGIVAFDLDHPDRQTFLKSFKNQYDPMHMASMPQPYDGFVIMRTCKNTNIQYKDLLPPNYTIFDNDPELTFIHPELKSRFVHYIGHKPTTSEKSIKINLGAGATRYPDFVNCDYDTKFNPEYVFDIEKDVWPFEDNSVTHIIAHHVLEHLGEGYFHALKEMYRVCKPGAHIDIHVPHFRNDNQFHDPTHRRTITPTGLLLFSKEFNDNNPHPGSKLGYHFGVDFKMLSSKDILCHGHPNYEYLKTLSYGDLQLYARERNNVFSETHIEIQVVK